MINNYYTCDICHHVNHAKRFHCSVCGTIPAEYSILSRPCRISDDPETLQTFIPVVVAHGVGRIESIRQTKTMMRTVPLDYYVEIE